MDDKDGQQPGPENRNQKAQRVEAIGVGVECLPAQEGGGVAGQVGEEEKTQQQTAAGHDALLADRGFKGVNHQGHALPR